MAEQQSVTNMDVRDIKISTAKVLKAQSQRVYYLSKYTLARTKEKYHRRLWKTTLKSLELKQYPADTVNLLIKHHNDYRKYKRHAKSFKRRSETSELDLDIQLHKLRVAAGMWLQEEGFPDSGQGKQQENVHVEETSDSTENRKESAYCDSSSDTSDSSVSFHDQ